MPKPRKFLFPEPRHNFPHNVDVLRWMARRGHQYLLDFQRAEKPLPTPKPLEDFLWELTFDEGAHALLLSHTMERRGYSTVDRVTYEWLDRTAAQQSNWLLKKFDADFLKRASNGGKLHGPRPPKTTAAQMRRFDDIPAHEVAAKLNIALSSVYRIRKQIRESDEMPQDDSGWYVPEQFDTPQQI